MTSATLVNKTSLKFLVLVSLSLAVAALLGVPAAIGQEDPATGAVSPETIEKYNEVKGAAKSERIDEAIEGNKTGTDPRDFSLKWMPYWRQTELENGLQQQDLTALAVIPFSKKLGAFLEVPLAQYRDFSDVSGFPEGTDGIGVGDVDLKFLFAGIDNVLIGTDMVFPTATDDALSGNSLLFSPIAGFIVDTPFHGFIAMMNLYYFDVYKEADAPKTSRYVAKVYLMQPLTKPGPWWGGLFLLPEWQPIYDFETEDFSNWIGVEFGKMIAPGKIAYIKPGWGVSNTEATDRKSTLEVGARWFF
jgi:hypothetical protein